MVYGWFPWSWYYDGLWLAPIELDIRWSMVGPPLSWFYDGLWLAPIELVLGDENETSLRLLGSRDPFSLQTDARSPITLEPINGVEPVFPGMVTISCS